LSEDVVHHRILPFYWYYKTALEDHGFMLFYYWHLKRPNEAEIQQTKSTVETVEQVRGSYSEISSADVTISVAPPVSEEGTIYFLRDSCTSH
jgi:hypothetical protein